MNALVLDRQNDARNIWQTVFGDVGIIAVFADSFTKELHSPRVEPRILVFDQSLIGNCLDKAGDICKQSILDIAVVTGAEISVAGAVRLMKLGRPGFFAKNWMSNRFEKQFH